MKRAKLIMMIVAIVTLAIDLSSCDNQANAQAPNDVNLTTVAFIRECAIGNSQTEQTVYICTGPQSKRFHKTSHCRGLNSCSGEILAVSISKAQSMGRTPCKWCYK